MPVKQVFEIRSLKVIVDQYLVVVKKFDSVCKKIDSGIAVIREI